MDINAIITFKITKQAPYGSKEVSFEGKTTELSDFIALSMKNEEYTHQIDLTIYEIQTIIDALQLMLKTKINQD